MKNDEKSLKITLNLKLQEVLDSNLNKNLKLVESNSKKNNKIIIIKNSYIIIQS